MKHSSAPKFGVDKGQYGTLVLGRRFQTDLTMAQVKAVHKTVAQWHEKSGLDLVFVSPGSAEIGAQDPASETFFAGLLIAHAKDGAPPVTVNKAALDPSRLDTVPQAFWDELQSKHNLGADGDEEADVDDDIGPSIGLFLAPAGWAVASLFLGQVEGDPLATSSSEDTDIGVHIDTATLATITESDAKLLLVGEYC